MSVVSLHKARLQRAQRRASAVPPSAVLHFLGNVLNLTRSDTIPHKIALDAVASDYNENCQTHRVGNFFVACVNTQRGCASAMDAFILADYPKQYLKGKDCTMLFAVTLAEAVYMTDWDAATARELRTPATGNVPAFLNLFSGMYERMADHVRVHGLDTASDALPDLFATMLLTSAAARLLTSEVVH